MHSKNLVKTFYKYWLSLALVLFWLVTLLVICSQKKKNKKTINDMQYIYGNFLLLFIIQITFLLFTFRGEISWVIQDYFLSLSAQFQIISPSSLKIEMFLASIFFCGEGGCVWHFIFLKHNTSQIDLLCYS